MSSPPTLSAERLTAVASRLLVAAGMAPVPTAFTAEVAWTVHTALSEPSAHRARNALYDVQDAQGHGSAADLVIELVMNGSAFPAEAYPVAAPTLEALGYELHRNGDGTHVVQIPGSLRTPREALAN